MLQELITMSLRTVPSHELERIENMDPALAKQRELESNERVLRSSLDGNLL